MGGYSGVMGQPWGCVVGVLQVQVGKRGMLSGRGGSDYRRARSHGDPKWKIHAVYVPHIWGRKVMSAKV